MKICDKCGAHCSDDKFFCVECNEKLGDKLSKAQEQKVSADISRKIEKMQNKRDALYVSKFDKIIGSLSLFLASLSLVFALVGFFIDRDSVLLLCATAFFLISGVEALFPRIPWEIEKLRLSLSINGADDAEPGDFYLIARKIAIVTGAVFGAAAIVLNFV